MPIGELGMAGVGAAAGVVNNVMDIAFGGMRQKQQLKGQKKALEQQNEANYDMWQKTNYGPQKEQMKAAGLNPGLMYGMGGGAGGQSMGASAMPSAGAQGGGGMDIGAAAQIALIREQARGLKIDNDKKLAETPGAGAQSDMTVQERDSRKGWTSVMSKTFGDEQEARQAIASTIGEMWKDGKLREGAEADLKEKLLKNAKTEEEKKAIMKGIEKMGVDIRTGQLNNEILELEKEMQTELGIDSKSPTWLKMIGRLFMKYFK
ncbi:MAG: DNA pilot protein [Microviridae sp.]|nr:MAG: DNA pilot protein [Microviridae sp.]